MGKKIMLQGTASNVGKKYITQDYVGYLNKMVIE